MILVNNKKTTAFSLYRKELDEELHNILSYWMQFTVDHENGGFFGSVSNDNIPDKSAAKGIVLNARICYSFSSAYRYYGRKEYQEMAERAYRFIHDFFIDPQYGGVYWSVAVTGNREEDKKQIYGLAFCIYSFAEYFKISGNKNALQKAIGLFESIELHSYDKKKNGYIEAFTRDWQPVADLRLSEKDSNERKTMNTHLHIIEAYACLYSVWPEPYLKQRIINLLDLFANCFINKNNYHLNLFFNDDWKPRSSLRSYGHDIEASWLLQQCAEIIDDKKYIEQFKMLSLPVLDAAAEGLDTDGGLWYEYEPEDDSLVYEKHAWPQAEAMVGFFNAWQNTGDEKWLGLSLNSWAFVKKAIRDKKNGEWFWGVYRDYSAIQKEKAGFWKCPYHSSRACLEIINRIDHENRK
jgi:cellobiose epimerase